MIWILQALDFALQLDVPGQQFIDFVDFVVGDDAQDMGEILLGVDVIELGCAQQTVEGGGSIATLVGTQEEIVFAADCDTSQGTFCAVMPRSGLCRLGLASQHSHSIDQDRLAA